MAEATTHSVPSGPARDEEFAPSLAQGLWGVALVGAGALSWWQGAEAAIDRWVVLQDRAALAALAEELTVIANDYLAGTILSAVIGALAVGLGVPMLLWARRGKVWLRPSGIEIVDWRGRAHAIPWGEIVAIRVITCGGLWRPPTVSITTPRGSWFIPPYVRERPRLIAEVIRRSGLQEQQRNWFSTRYAR